MFDNKNKKGAMRITLALLHSIDGLIVDTKKGKLSTDDLGKIMLNLHDDVIEARKATRGL